MRFLLNDKQMLELSFMILLAGPHVSSSFSAPEKEKIYDSLDVLIHKFFRCEHTFKELKTGSRKIQHLPEEYVGMLNKNVVDYYQSKAAGGFKFRTWDDDDSDEAAQKDQPAPQTLQLPLAKNEPHEDGQSNAGGGKKDSESSSNSSRSDSDKSKRPLTEAERK